MHMAITVTNAQEDGTVTLALARPSVGTPITASLEDPDNVVADTVTWQWLSSDAMRGTCDSISGATSASYTVAESDAGMYLQAKANTTTSTPPARWQPARRSWFRKTW